MKFLYPDGLADAFSTDSKFHPSFPYLSLGEKVIVTGSFKKNKKVCDVTKAFNAN